MKHVEEPVNQHDEPANQLPQPNPFRLILEQLALHLSPEELRAHLSVDSEVDPDVLPSRPKGP